MGLGAGILLSAMVIGLVLLYGQTRDRWRWKKVFLTALVVTVTIACVAWAYSEYENRIMAQSEFLSISLGSKVSDVRFIKGNPDMASMDGGVWIFNDSNKKAELLVLFRDTVVKAVLYIGDCFYCNQMFGLGIGASYEKVKEKVGEPTSVSISPDQLKRLASFEKWNVVFILQENKVINFGIYDPKLGPVVFSERAWNLGSNPGLQI